MTWSAHKLQGPAIWYPVNMGPSFLPILIIPEFPIKRTESKIWCGARGVGISVSNALSSLKKKKSEAIQ